MTHIHSSPPREGGKPQVTVKDMKVPPTDEDFIKLITKNLDMCQPLPLGLPPERDLGPVIPLKPGTRPYMGHSYRMSPGELKECHEQIQELLRKGYIEKSMSPWATPCLFEGKKDGGLRPVIDYRRRNAATIPNRWPLPRIDDLFDKLGGCSHFSTLDLQAGYNQCRIRPEEEPLTAVRTPFGLFQWKVLSMGLTNAPAAFAAFMAKVFDEHIGDFVYIYLDDLIIFSRSKEEHLVHLQKVFDVLRKEQLFIKLSKCEIAKPEVTFLGHIVGKDGVKVDITKFEVINKWKTPTTLSELRKILGQGNFFRRFIIGYSSLTAPLTDLTSKKVNWSPSPWTQVHEDALEE